jgi:hypothetical protein
VPDIVAEPPRCKSRRLAGGLQDVAGENGEIREGLIVIFQISRFFRTPLPRRPITREDFARGDAEEHSFSIFQAPPLYLPPRAARPRHPHVDRGGSSSRQRTEGSFPGTFVFDFSGDGGPPPAENAKPQFNSSFLPVTDGSKTIFALQLRGHQGAQAATKLPEVKSKGSKPRALTHANALHHHQHGQTPLRRWEVDGEISRGEATRLGRSHF